MSTIPMSFVLVHTYYKTPPPLQDNSCIVDMMLTLLYDAHVFRLSTRIVQHSMRVQHSSTPSQSSISVASYTSTLEKIAHRIVADIALVLLMFVMRCNKGIE